MCLVWWVKFLSMVGISIRFQPWRQCRIYCIESYVGESASAKVTPLWSSS